MSKTSVVVPVYNQVGLTQQLLDSLCEFTPPDQLIVVDNGSSDGTAEYLQGLQRQCPNVTILRQPTNLGFAKAVNLGLKVATGDVLIVLSNDVRIVTLDWLSELTRMVEDHPRALAGPMIITTNDWTKKADGEHLPYVAGWLLAFHRDFLTDVGYLEEDYPLYFEDTELSYRALQAGYALVEIPELGLFHQGGGTGRLLEKPMRLCLRSRRMFARKYGIEFSPHWSEIEFPEEGEFEIEEKGLPHPSFHDTL